MLPGPETLYPISDQKHTIFHTLFQTWLSMYTLLQTLWGTVISATLNEIYSDAARATVTPPCACFFPLCPRRHVTCKIVPRPNRQNIYLFQTKIAKSIPYFTLEMPENDTLWGGTYLYGLYMEVTPPSLRCFGHRVQLWETRFASLVPSNCLCGWFPYSLLLVLRSAHTRGHVAGTCRGEEFHALFTRRGMLRG